EGRRTFDDIQEGGRRIQLFCSIDAVGEQAYGVLDLLDIGDIVGVSGQVMRTRTGQESVEVQTLELLAKALRPLPEKWHGLKDVEPRYRQRYVDLIVNPGVRAVVIARSTAVAAIRRLLTAP